jgi:hypothetical protein
VIRDLYGLKFLQLNHPKHRRVPDSATISDAIIPGFAWIGHLVENVGTTWNGEYQTGMDPTPEETG